MLQFLSKTFKLGGRTWRYTTAFVPLSSQNGIKTLYNTQQSFVHSQQKELIKYPNELRPFTPNNLWDNEGARKIAKRLGRGRGTGKGKTAGRGHKGQRARSGGTLHPAFEGGQTPLTERIPKWGMHRRNNMRYNYINLERLAYLINHGRLNPENTITIKSLFDAGAFKKIPYGVKVLSKGAEKLTIPIKLEVSDASQAAIEAIKKLGGSVTCVYRTKLKLKEHLKPHMFKFTLDEPLPAKKSVLKMEKIRERGAEVVYNMPDWIKTHKEEVAKAEKELKESGLEYPAPRHEGVGKDKIRQRKKPLQKTIDYALK